MADLIDQGLQQRKRWILPEPISRSGSLLGGLPLWRVASALYLRQVRKRFKGEL